MNTAQRRVLVRGLLLAGVVFGLLGFAWLADDYTPNDGRGLLLLILGAGAIIAGLFVRAGAPPTSAPRAPLPVRRRLEIAATVLSVVGLGLVLTLSALYGGRSLTPGIGFLAGVGLAAIVVTACRSRTSPRSSARPTRAWPSATPTSSRAASSPSCSRWCRPIRELTPPLTPRPARPRTRRDGEWLTC